MKYSLGCLRDLPDARDWYIDTHPEAAKHFHTRPVFGHTLTSDWSVEARQVDLRAHCSPIEDQLTIGSCTAQTVAGMAEYLERRAHGNHIDVSRLFVYKATRNLLGWTGDTGAYIRAAIKAMVVFGAPPERYWPYQVERFEEEPSAFAYAYGQSLQALSYFRIDRPGLAPGDVLRVTKAVLHAGVPVGLGFVVFNGGNDQGDFAFPGVHDVPQGGHAVMIAGYDDDREINGHTGALLVRNSWGTNWGDNGYGWLPYEYLLQGLVWDIWALHKMEYLDHGPFE